MRLIDADALANRMQFLIRTHHRDAFDALNEIDNAPTIDPESLRPQGFWEEYETSSFYGYDDNHEPKWAARKFYRCERCRKGTAVRSNYCPNCGAKMKGEQP